MKLEELSGTHLGRRVTITTPFVTVTGFLKYVASSASTYTNTPVGAPPELHVSRIEVDVHVGEFKARFLSGNIACEVHELEVGENV
jgi:hypothetical protein